MIYLTDRTQYVQIDDRSSERLNVSFGVPQRFILCPILFNLYVNDLTDVLSTEVNCHQYVNDITIFSHCKPSELLRVVGRRCRLSTWSFRCNLALHPKKTKVMLLSTPQMSQTHRLDGHCIHLCANGRSRERVSTFRLLGTEVHENVNWKRAINCKISSCYGTLSVLKKLKYLAPYNVRKHLAECLILSKMDYNDIVSDTIADYLVRLLRVQLAAAKLSSWSSRCNYVTRRILHQSLRKWKGSRASFNVPVNGCWFCFRTLRNQAWFALLITFIHSHSSLENPTRFQTKMSKVYTRFQTQTVQIPYGVQDRSCYQKFSGKLLVGRYFIKYIAVYAELRIYIMVIIYTKNCKNE